MAQLYHDPTPLAAALSLVIAVATLAATPLHAAPQQSEYPRDNADHSLTTEEVRTIGAGAHSAPTGFGAQLDGNPVVLYNEDRQAQPVLPTEPTPLLYALDLVQASWLRGPHYEVENKVFLSGGFPVFFVKSEFGPLEVSGVELLAIRIEEFQALAELERISRLDVFGKSASRAVKRTAIALKNVLSSPIETIKNVPGAIGRKLRETFASARESAKNLADQARDGMRNDDGDLIAANPFLPPPPPDVQLTEAEREALRDVQAKKIAKQAGQSYIGYNKSRRELARMLGIDPYSRNPLILQRLDELAWSSLAGSAGTGMTIGALTGGVSTVISKSRQLNNLVWDLPEADLKKRNRAELKRAGFINSAARALIRNGAFTTSLQTTYVDLVVQLRNTRGAQRLLELGANARDELDARYLIHAVAAALDYQARYQPIARVRAISNQPVFEIGRRGLLVAAPADYLYLSDEMWAFLELEEFANTENVLLTHARLTPRLRYEFDARNWTVQSLQVSPGLPYAQPDE